jgi:hypothetical protein
MYTIGPVIDNFFTSVPDVNVQAMQFHAQHVHGVDRLED